MNEVARPITVSPSVASFAALTPTLLPATHTQSYALGDREVLLVEPATPYEDEQRAWVEWARGIESSGRKLLAMVATHHHPDHVGGARFFREALGLPLWAHAATASRIPEPVDRVLVEGERLVLDGTRPTCWEVLHTPGHAPGHVCLFEPDERTLVLGDMMASVGTILIEPVDGDMTLYLASLDRLAGLEAVVGLPAHGDAIAEPSRRLRGYITHRLMRENVIADAVTKAPGSTLGELCPVAYADTNPALWPIARLSLEAHLVKLIRDGKVRLDGDRYLTSS